MRKILILTLCLSLIFTLVSCNSEKKANKVIQATNKNQTLEDSPENINDSIQDTNEKNNDSQKITKVNSKIELYEGAYWDERCLGDNGLNLKNYCEVVISNTTATSFDFTVYEVDRQTENRKVIFLTNTAVFTEDGTKATFYGNNYTLNFTFPSITEIKISGFEPLEGKTYLNNKIPGHECS